MKSEVSTKDVYDLVDKKISELDYRMNHRLDKIDDRLDSIDSKNEENNKEIASLKVKTSNQTVFQTVLTFVIGAIASFLGAKR